MNKTKVICIEDYTEDCYTIDGITIVEGRYYLMEEYNEVRDIYSLEGIFITYIYNSIFKEYFLTESEWREKQINEILK